MSHVLSREPSILINFENQGGSAHTRTYIHKHHTDSDKQTDRQTYQVSVIEQLGNSRAVLFM